MWLYERVGLALMGSTRGPEWVKCLIVPCPRIRKESAPSLCRHIRVVHVNSESTCQFQQDTARVTYSLNCSLFHTNRSTYLKERNVSVHPYSECRFMYLHSRSPSQKRPITYNITTSTFPEFLSGFREVHRVFKLILGAGPLFLRTLPGTRVLKKVLPIRST